MPRRRGGEVLKLGFKQVKLNFHPEVIMKLTFRALARCRRCDQGPTLETSASLFLHGGNLTLISNLS